MGNVRVGTSYVTKVEFTLINSPQKKRPGTASSFSFKRLKLGSAVPSFCQFGGLNFKKNVMEAENFKQFSL